MVHETVLLQSFKATGTKQELLDEIAAARVAERRVGAALVRTAVIVDALLALLRRAEAQFLLYTAGQPDDLLYKLEISGDTNGARSSQLALAFGEWPAVGAAPAFSPDADMGATDDDTTTR